MKKVLTRVLNLTVWFLGPLIIGLTGAPIGMAQEGPRILDEIVAKINDEIVTLTDLNSAINERRLELRQETGDSEEAEKRFKAEERLLLRNYIQTRLMLQKAQELGFDADIDVEVAAFMENMRKEMGIPSLEVLDQYLRQQGSSLQRFREKVKDNMMTRSLIQNFVYGKITLLTQELEKYYNDNIESFTEPARVELAEILLLTEGKDKNVVRARAEEVLQRLNQGEAFEEMAKEYSEGPTASDGGKIGSFNKGTMNTGLEAAAFSIDIGTHSEIVESSYGFQIIKTLNRFDASVKPMDEVRPQIAEALYQRKARPEMEEFVKELVRDSYIFISPKYAEQYDVQGLI